MDRDNQPITVSALIVTRNVGETIEILNVLAHNKTKYGFPGGKLEPGETADQAVIRETEEELGVVPSNVVYLDAFTALTPEGRGIEMHVFSGNVTEDIAPNSEIAELHWMTLDQMLQQKEMLTPMTSDHVLPMLKARKLA